MKPFVFYLALFAGLLSGRIGMGQNNINDDYYVPLQKQPTNYSGSSNLIYAGLGEGGYYPYSGLKYFEDPTLTLMYERVIFNHLGPGTLNLGPVLSYKKIASYYMDDYSGYTYAQNWNYYHMGARISYHLHIFPSKVIEPYAGAMFGYYVTGFKFISNDPNYNNPTDPAYYLSPNNYPNFFALSIFAGIRSTIGYHSSIWLEVGYGNTSIAFGLCYSL